MTTRRVWIIRHSDGSPVEASLDTELDPSAFKQAEQIWGPERQRAVDHLRAQGKSRGQLPQHAHWDWAQKASRLQFLSYRGFGIECEGLTQGLMLTLLDGKCARLGPALGRPLVYIEYVETAPWNAKEFTDSPTFRGVGTRLFQAAVELSVQEEFGGRVGLHALAQSEDFYSRRCLMECLGVDPAYQNLTYFELSTERVKQLLAG